jgi:hypothetical protein
MKKLTTLIASLLLAVVCMQSHASLITLSTAQASYATGDTVLLDISLSDIPLNAQNFSFILGFDGTELNFPSFLFSSNIEDSKFFSSYEVVGNSIEFIVNWFTSAPPSTDFSFGQVSFTATGASSPVFDVTEAVLVDSTFTVFDVPSESVSVPAPAAGLLMLLGLVLLPLQRKMFSK